MGRPSEYRPEYCQALVDHLSEGLSFDSFPATLIERFGRGAFVRKSTLYNWLKEHRDFLDAKEEGTARGFKLWEMIGRNAAAGRIEGFSASAWIFNMKNRYGWRDRIEHTGDVNNPIAVKQIGQTELKSIAEATLRAIEYDKDETA